MKMLLTVVLGVLLGLGTAYGGTIYDGTWTTIADDDGPVGPGGGGQPYDAEYLAYKIEGNSLFLGLQSGFDLGDMEQPWGSSSVYGGDLAMSFDGDSSYYEYAIDYGFYTAGWSGPGQTDPEGLYQVTSWNTDTYYGVSGPLYQETGVLVSSLLDNDYFQTGDSYFRWVELEITGLPPGEDIDLWWTMSCGNDTISSDFRVIREVPEPGTMMLFGTGLLGLAGLSRRRK